MGDEDDYGDLFSRTRLGDPHTSREAVADIAKRLNKIQAMVLDYFRAIYPRAITDLDLQDHFANHGSTYRTRRSELAQKGLLEDTGRRVVQNGHNRILWRAVAWEGMSVIVKEGGVTP